MSLVNLIDKRKFTER